MYSIFSFSINYYNFDTVFGTESYYLLVFLSAFTASSTTFYSSTFCRLFTKMHNML